MNIFKRVYTVGKYIGSVVAAAPGNRFGRYPAMRPAYRVQEPGGGYRTFMLLGGPGVGLEWGAVDIAVPGGKWGETSPPLCPSRCLEHVVTDGREGRRARRAEPFPLVIVFGWETESARNAALIGAASMSTSRNRPDARSVLTGSDVLKASGKSGRWVPADTWFGEDVPLNSAEREWADGPADNSLTGEAWRTPIAGPDFPVVDKSYEIPACGHSISWWLRKDMVLQRNENGNVSLLVDDAMIAPGERMPCGQDVEEFFGSDTGASYVKRSVADDFLPGLRAACDAYISECPSPSCFRSPVEDVAEDGISP